MSPASFFAILPSAVIEKRASYGLEEIWMLGFFTNFEQILLFGHEWAFAIIHIKGIIKWCYQVNRIKWINLYWGGEWEKLWTLTLDSSWIEHVAVLQIGIQSTSHDQPRRLSFSQTSNLGDCRGYFYSTKFHTILIRLLATLRITPMWYHTYCKSENFLNANS